MLAPPNMTWNNTKRGRSRQPTASGGPMRLLQRPDLSVLSEAIPLFFIGQNKDGLWVARDADARIGGIFLLKHSAERFADRNALPWGCAKVFLDECLELDVENSGNPLAARLGAVRRFISGLAQQPATSTAKTAAAGWRRIAWFATALAEQRMHRALLEAELYINGYRHSSKNDDDLPIVELPIVGSAPAVQPAPSVSPRVAWRRAAGAVVAMTKRAYPVILVFAIFATVLVATFAIRLAIWLPLYRH
jgi:hypothetical protein